MLAILRHELYKEIVKTRKQVGPIMGDEEAQYQMFQMMYESVWDKYERTRKEVFEKVLGTKIERPQDAKLKMLKAFITFSFRNREDGDAATEGKKHFSELIEESSTLDREYVNDMFKG